MVRTLKKKREFNVFSISKIAQRRARSFHLKTYHEIILLLWFCTVLDTKCKNQIYAFYINELFTDTPQILSKSFRSS